MATGSSPEPLRNRVQSRLHLLKPKVTSGPPFLSEDLNKLNQKNKHWEGGQKKKSFTSCNFCLSIVSFISSLRVHISTDFHRVPRLHSCVSSSRRLVFEAGCSSGCLESFYCRGIRVVAALHPRSRILQVRKAQSPDWLHVEHLGTAQTGRRILLRSRIQ